MALIYNDALAGCDRRWLHFEQLLGILYTLLRFRRPMRFVECKTCSLADLRRLLGSDEGVEEILAEITEGPLKWIARQSEMDI